MNSLTQEQINDFIENGYIKIENAFSAEIAAKCISILWKETGCDPNDFESWKQPVIRIGELDYPPFIEAANTPILHNAFDQLVGKDNWYPKQTLGSFPIRFPCKITAIDTGWHVDASFPGNQPDNYFEWRINVHSKSRGLLMLFLFSDVTEHDAPTILKVGSHFDIAKILETEGENGLSFMELASQIQSIPERNLAYATGKAGTVYLCHPFLVHAAQDHHGISPKFMAQPALMTKNHFSLKSPDKNSSPVVQAILKGLSY